MRKSNEWIDIQRSGHLNSGRGFTGDASSYLDRLSSDLNELIQTAQECKDRFQEAAQTNRVVYTYDECSYWVGEVKSVIQKLEKTLQEAYSDNDSEWYDNDQEE